MYPGRLINVDARSMFGTGPVLVKGGDYAIDAIVGADIVRGYGGQVRLAEFVDGHSTTATLARASRRCPG